MTWYYILLLAAYVGTIISMVAVVVSENRNPVKSLAWITVLLMVPVFGAVLYVFFGRSLKNVHVITRRSRRRLCKREAFRKVEIDKIPFSRQCVQQVKLAHTLSGAIYYPGNNIEIFTNGGDKFIALEQDLLQAKDYIHLQYYIFEDDNVGNRISDILIAKARQGVKVRVIYDHVGSIHASNKFFKRMTEAGVMIYPFLRVTFRAFATHINWRNHRKLAIIDGKVGYIGGMNIADRYIDGGRFECWRDTHLRIRGAAVGALQYSFAADWNFMGQPVLEESTEQSFSFEPQSAAGVQMLTSGPTSQWSNIAMVFQKAITGASKCVYIQTPYFLPPEALLKALQSVALSKVDVRIMMPKESDSALMRYASFSYIQECLRSGIKIYLYEKGMLHSKVLIVDDEFVSVGSTNFDFRSFECNFESNVFIYSRDVNKRMRDIFITDIKDCERITISRWRHRPPIKKMHESMARMLSPIL